jgi:hypothetical protein
MTKWILFSLFAATSAIAQARPSTWTMTCDQDRALVQENGAIVLNYDYQGDNVLYDRFVSDARYCDPGEHLETAYVHASDTDSCIIGYVCRQHQGR